MGSMFEACGPATENALSPATENALSPATENALSPNDNQVLGNSRVRMSADHKPLLQSTEVVSAMRSARYRGALPCKHR